MSYTRMQKSSHQVHVNFAIQDRMVVTASERSKRVSSGYSGAVVLGLQRTRRLAAAGWVCGSGLRFWMLWEDARGALQITNSLHNCYIFLLNRHP